MGLVGLHMETWSHGVEAMSQIFTSQSRFTKLQTEATTMVLFLKLSVILHGIHGVAGKGLRLVREASDRSVEFRLPRKL